MGAAIVVTEADFKPQVLESPIPAVVDFYADWCGPCVRMTPVVEELAKEFEGRVKVCKLNVTDSNAIATQYSIMSIPTLICFKSGQIVAQSVGALTRDQLRAKLDALLVPAQPAAPA